MPNAPHDEYLASSPEDVRPRLAAIQAQVESLLPHATRCISYRMPAYRGRTRIFFYFAAFKKHIGVYPPLRHDAALIAELAPYRGEKGNLSFPLNQPLPIELIGRVAVALHREYELEREQPHKPA
ncbi:iron chaperone [Sphaerotilus microaerophilus]|uniref:YdhG-like domain-containing protein n=1 Tax=Sphaerotilus microaerophilus TaxID=2914710 RepID=A0ABN6PQ66_9BURK|nr:DUF1801 domain-containing protein [Sphaerotilus sp. FB-5]BDI07340.1 hypothetical protein CATMQ487_43100 [Sphaerotilus sp. FB-5]